METKRLAIGSQILAVQIGAAKEVEVSSESVFDKVVFISAADIREFLFAAEIKKFPEGGGGTREAAVQEFNSQFVSDFCSFARLLSKFVPG